MSLQLCSLIKLDKHEYGCSNTLSLSPSESQFYYANKIVIYLTLLFVIYGIWNLRKTITDLNKAQFYNFNNILPGLFNTSKYELYIFLFCILYNFIASCFSIILFLILIVIPTLIQFYLYQFESINLYSFCCSNIIKSIKQSQCKRIFISFITFLPVVIIMFGNIFKYIPIYIAITIFLNTIFSINFGVVGLTLVSVILSNQISSLQV